MKYLIAGVALLMSATAQAGPYLFAEGGRATADFDLDNFHEFNRSVEANGGQAALSDDDRDSAFSLGVGYAFTPNWAVEVSYLNLGEFSAQSDTSDTTSTGFNRQRHIKESLDVSGLNFSGVGRLPMTSSLSLEGLAGFAWLKQKGTGKAWGQTFNEAGEAVRTQYQRAHDDRNDWAPLLGVGVRYQLNDHWQAGLRYRRLFDAKADMLDEYDLDLFTAGVSYQF